MTEATCLHTTRTGYAVGSGPGRVTARLYAPGYNVSLGFHRLSPDRVVELFEQAGFSVRMRPVREPEGAEKVPQAHLSARKRSARGRPATAGAPAR